jgi:8-oxo-dGTP diphosphatase
MSKSKQLVKFFVGVKGLIVQDDKLLLLKKSERDYIEQSFWDLPGGRIDDQENPQKTLQRELKEELIGIKQIKVGDLVWAYRVPYKVEKDSNLFLIYYLVEADVSQTKLSPEHVEKKWVGVEQFDQLNAPVNANFKGLLRNILKNKSD